MAVNPKYDVAQLTKLVEYLLEGEPVFIIRAKDAAAESAVEQYIDCTKRMGGTNVSRSTEHLQRIRQWRVDNPAKLKPAD